MKKERIEKRLCQKAYDNTCIDYLDLQLKLYHDDEKISECKTSKESKGVKYWKMLRKAHKSRIRGLYYFMKISKITIQAMIHHKESSQSQLNNRLKDIIFLAKISAPTLLTVIYLNKADKYDIKAAKLWDKRKNTKERR